MNKRVPLICFSAFAVLASACSHDSARVMEDMMAEGDRLEEEARNKRVPRTYEAFISSADYTLSRDMWRGAALNQYNPANSYVEVLLDKQRGRLYINDKIAMDFPVCSGRFGGNETPTGTFRITQKVEDYRSNLYGSYVDANENVVERGADSRKKGPEGTHFLGSSMPYWMRFNGAVGMHVGSVHREGRSHGCVRVPVEACSILFSKLAVGSKVIVK